MDQLMMKLLKMSSYKVKFAHITIILHNDDESIDIFNDIVLSTALPLCALISPISIDAKTADAIFTHAYSFKREISILSNKMRFQLNVLRMRISWSSMVC